MLLRWIPALALFTVGCADPVSSRAQQQREALLLRDARALRRCLGPPTEIEHVADGEIWYIVWPVEPDWDRPRAFKTPIYDAIEQPQRRVEQLLTTPSSAAVAPGYCRLRLRLGPSGRLLELDAEGLYSSELNADDRCILMTAPCVLVPPQ